MSEIDRVFTAIDGFFQAGGENHPESLIRVVERSTAGAMRRYAETDMQDNLLLDRIKAAHVQVKLLGKAPPQDVEALKEQFKVITKEAMIVRRSTLPLDNPAAPWKPFTADEAMFDDDDVYSFAIFDTLIEEISALLPVLHQLALEASDER